MGTAGPHLGPLKNPNRAKSRYTWSQRIGDQSQHPVPDEEEEEEDEDPSTGAVWIPAEDFKKLILIYYKWKY